MLGLLSNTIVHLPTNQRQRFDELASNEYFGDSFSKGETSIVVVKTSPVGQIRFLSTWGQALREKAMSHITLEHDQTRAKIGAEVIAVVSGAMFADETARPEIHRYLASRGVDLNRKYSVSVYK